MDFNLNDYIKRAYSVEAAKDHAIEVKKSINEPRFTEFEIALTNATRDIIMEQGSVEFSLSHSKSPREGITEEEDNGPNG